MPDLRRECPCLGLGVVGAPSITGTSASAQCQRERLRRKGAEERRVQPRVERPGDVEACDGIDPPAEHDVEGGEMVVDRTAVEVDVLRNWPGLSGAPPLAPGCILDLLRWRELSPLD